MKTVFKICTFALVLVMNKSFGETKGFYCSAMVWRVYSVLPKASATVDPIVGTHRVIEQSVQNKENQGKGILALFKPAKDGEFNEYLEFKDGYAIAIRAISAPNGSISFVVKLVTREGKSVTNILSEHREVFQVAQKEVDRVPLSIDLPNINISNAYLKLRTSTLTDRNYDALASSIAKGQLVDGSITEASVECTPVLGN